MTSSLVSCSPQAWHRVHGACGILHIILGVVLALWALTQTLGEKNLPFSLLLGGIVLGLGAVGAFGLWADVPSARTLYVVIAGLAGVLALSLNTQLTKNVQHDCWMAERWIKLDLLQEGILGVGHDEVLDAVLARIETMHDDIRLVTDGSAPAFEKREAQTHTHAADRSFLTEKFDELSELASEALEHLEEEVANAALEVREAKKLAPEDDAKTHDSETKDEKPSDDDDDEEPSPKEKLENLITNHEFLKEQLDILKKLIKKLEGQTSETMTSDTYEDMLADLEEITEEVGNDKTGSKVQEALDNIQDTHDIMDRVEADLDEDDESKMTGEELDRHKILEKHREEFEKRVEEAKDESGGLFSSKDDYLETLEDRMEDLPKVCLSETSIRGWWFGSMICWSIIVSAAAGAYVALTAMVESKKDL